MSKTYRIRLIGFPDFFRPRDPSIDFSFNMLFWDFIFNFEKSSKFIRLKNLNEDEKKNILYIKKYLQLSFSIFLLAKDKYISVQSIVFAFNIIDSYLKLLSKSGIGMTLYFYMYFSIHKDSSQDKNNNILYQFFLQEGSCFFSSLDIGDTLHFDIRYSEQIIQVQFIKDILQQYYSIDIAMSFDVSNLIEYENKKSLSQTIQGIFGSDKEISLLSHNLIPSKQIFGRTYKHYPFFNGGCSWRRCTFCNIGKYSKYYTKKNNWDSTVTSMLETIQQDKTHFVGLIDPSITVEELKFLSHKIIEKKLDIRIHLRTKFTDEITEKDMQLFSQAGVKFMGIGLEHTSSRLNRLMQKYDKDYTKEDFARFISLGEKYGIVIHYYTILGFPTETQEEIYDLRDFLIEQTKKSQFFCFTPGFFGLAKGTYVYENYKEFGIEFDETQNGAELFINHYKEKMYDQNKKLLKATQKELLDFFFFFGVESGVNIEYFWYFIEQSNILHIMQMIFEKNPFHQYFSQNQNASTHSYYQKNNFIQPIKKQNHYVLKNWVTMNSKEVSGELYNFFLSYDQNKFMYENMDSFGIGDGDEIKNLIQNYFFIRCERTSL